MIEEVDLWTGKIHLYSDPFTLWEYHTIRLTKKMNSDIHRHFEFEAILNPKLKKKTMETE